MKSDELDMRYFELINYGKEKLAAADIDTFSYDARELLLYASGMTTETLLSSVRDECPSETEEKYRLCIKRRSERYPLQYIMGYTYFMGYKMKVSPDVLIPRPETEEVVLAALKLTDKNNSLKALDLCTGSGCIGISLYLERLKQRKTTLLTMSDISENALLVAESNVDSLIGNIDKTLAFSENGEKSGKSDITLTASDLFDNISGKFDLIISNPPYIKTGDIESLMPEVADYEPRIALDGDVSNPDGVAFYKEIIRKAGEYLNDDGIICLEIGHDERDAVAGILVDNSFKDIKVSKDINGLDRIVTAGLNKHK